MIPFVFLTMLSCIGDKDCKCGESEMISSLQNGDITTLISNIPKREKKIYDDVFSQNEFSLPFLRQRIYIEKSYFNDDTFAIELCIDQECLELNFIENNGQCLMVNYHDFLAFLFWKDYQKRFTITHLLMEQNMPKAAIHWLDIPSIKTDKAKAYIEESRLKIDNYGRRILGKEKLISMYKKLALAGDTHAMYMLGHWYDKSHLEFSPNYKLPSDYQEDTSFKWYLKAAQLGEASSINKVAEIYEKGTELDKKEAYKWYHKLNEYDENTFSHLQLHKIYQLGIGCKINISISKHHLERAMLLAKENENGAFEMANAYEDGLYGLEENKSEAIQWYTRSVDLGNENARFYLSNLLRE